MRPPKGIGTKQLRAILIHLLTEHSRAVLTVRRPIR